MVSTNLGTMLASFKTKIYTPKYATRDFLFFFFFPANRKNCHRHVNGFGDLLFISLLCDRAKSSKILFSIQ